jgi:hypothetical protein
MCLNLTKVDLYKAVLNDTKEIISNIIIDEDLKKELYESDKNLLEQIDLYKKAFDDPNIIFPDFMINFLNNIENCLIFFQQFPNEIQKINENDIYSSYAFLWCILYQSKISKLEDIKTFNYDNIANFSAFLNKQETALKIKENYEKNVKNIIKGEISSSNVKYFVSKLKNGTLTTIKKKKKHRSKNNKTKKLEEEKEEELKEEEKKEKKELNEEEEEKKEVTKKPNEKKKEEDKIEVEKEEDQKEENLKKDETKLKKKESEEVNEVQEKEEKNKEKKRENEDIKEEEKVKTKEGIKEGDIKNIIEGGENTNEEKTEKEKEEKEKNINNENEKKNTNNLFNSKEERISVDQLALIVQDLNKKLLESNDKISQMSENLNSTNSQLSEANNKISQMSENYNSQLSKANEKISQLSENLNSTNSQLSEANEKISHLSENLNSTNSQLSEFKEKIKNLENNQKLLFYQLSMYQARDITKNIYYYFCKHLSNSNGEKPFEDLKTIMNYFNKNDTKDEIYTLKQKKILRKFFRVIFFINKANNRILHNNLSSAVNEAIEKKEKSDFLSLLPPNNYAQLFETLKNYLDLNVKNEQLQEAFKFVYKYDYINDDKIKDIKDNNSEAIKKENDSIKFLITKEEIDEAKKLFDVIKIGNETFDQLCNAKTYDE